MRYFKNLILGIVLSAFICLKVNAEITVNELFFDSEKPFHLKILEAIPEDGIIQIGDDNAKNTIIESYKSKNITNGKVKYSNNNRLDTNNILKFY